MENIWNKIKQFPQEEYSNFIEFFRENLYDRQWCFMNKIKYSNPNFNKALNVAYQEFSQNPQQPLSQQNASLKEQLYKKDS